MTPNQRRKYERLAKSAKFGRLDLDDLLDRCRDGRAQFFENEETAVITSLEVSGIYRMCYVNVVGGTLEGLMALEPVIDKFAREHHCEVIRTISRFGFVNKLQKRKSGYKPIGVLFEKDLRDGT